MVTLHGEHREWATGTAVTPLSETAAAIAVIVLAILGLLNVASNAMMAIATIIVGAAMLLQGAQVVGEYSRWATSGSAGAVPGAVGGVTLDFLAGGVGIVLGILALFAQTPTLAPAALIVFGGTLLLTGMAMGRRTLLPSAPTAVPGADAAELVATQMASVAAGAQVMLGIAGIVLGVLALVPIHGIVLTLVGLLAVGSAVLVAGIASGGVAVAEGRA